MGYRPVLCVEIEALGAKFLFRPPDAAIARLFAAAQETEASKAGAGVLESGLVLPLVDVFVEGVRDWEGVCGQDGAELPCTEENVLGIPTLDKIEIASAYVERALAIEGKELEPGVRRTESMPPESSMAVTGG